MKNKIVINAALNRKADFYAPEKCVVEKVVELSENEFKKLLEKPLENRYFIKQYCDEAEEDIRLGRTSNARDVIDRLREKYDV